MTGDGRCQGALGNVGRQRQRGKGVVAPLGPREPESGDVHPQGEAGVGGLEVRTGAACRQVHLADIPGDDAVQGEPRQVEGRRAVPVIDLVLGREPHDRNAAGRDGPGQPLWLQQGVVRSRGAGERKARSRDGLARPDIGRGVIPAGGGQVEADGVARHLPEKDRLGDVQVGCRRAIVGLVAGKDPGHPNRGLADRPRARRRRRQVIVEEVRPAGGREARHREARRHGPSASLIRIVGCARRGHHRRALSGDKAGKLEVRRTEAGERAPVVDLGGRADD